MGPGSSEQRFVAVHEADLAPAVEDGVDAQAPMVDNDVQEGQEVLVGDGGVEIVEMINQLAFDASRNMEGSAAMHGVFFQVQYYVSFAWFQVVFGNCLCLHACRSMITKFVVGSASGCTKTFINIFYFALKKKPNRYRTKFGNRENTEYIS